MESLNSCLLVATLVYVGLVLYMRLGWYRTGFSTTRTKVQNLESVSVLIAARNEEENIERTLDCMVAQSYPKHLLEVIVIDDHSTDRTAEIVRGYHDQGVRLLQLDEGDKLNSYKKLAIAKAIDLSSGNIIMTTDADCRMGPNWIKTVVDYMERGRLEMVSSPVAYHEEKSLFERLQTLEFLYLIGLGASGIGNGVPTTCNGANLAYRKETFYRVGGFKGIDDLASGDDELLLHKVSEGSAHQIGFCKSSEAIVYTEAKPTLASFISQRKRWASKSTKYKDKRIVALGIVIWLFNFALLWGTVQFFYMLPVFDWVFAICVVLKVAVEFIFLLPITQFVRRTELLRYLPFLSFAHALYLVYIGVAGNIGKYDWKGRTVK
ncbi:glycosyltransferase [Sphingobacterium sp. lm-10]|uniref:glycosyltransferase family 2 protein n=1 Tax=Sphingobacterium sp. lm-10 TaxID=2944904 RepID=UPI0020222731|nr:glycosyltransferase [Sphingobacterium sp. lm-10]MCL7988836.1 glycosyltransferase [Sphingobacterium sp. lm-10]